MARFIVVKANTDGGVEIHPMKEWLRQHPEHIPQNMDATSSTSRQLLAGLKKNGWKYEETDSEVRLFQPGEKINSGVLSSVLGESVDTNNGEKDQGFSLEKQLRDFLADNISSIKINGKSLQVFVDQTGRDGIEYPTEVGFIDVLCIDNDGNFFVFELKRDIGTDRVVGQLARYMGWVQNTIGRGKEVIGVIVAKQIGQKLRYAASIIPKVFLYEYRVEFHLYESSEING